jgi:two-component sensor histidine kinase
MIRQSLNGVGDVGAQPMHLVDPSEGLQAMGHEIGIASRPETKHQELNSGENARDQSALVKQCLKYAEDLVKIYEEEKQKRKALENANGELSREIRARIRAEDELRKGRSMLEERVRQRTRDLESANQHLQTEIDRRRQFEAQLRESLREKETLLSEVHHRVKNNLQIISSLLGLQCMLVQDHGILAALTDSQNRIRSMALIHEQLYRSSNLAAINFSDYVHGLVAELLRANIGKGYTVSTKVTVEDVLLPVGMALSCGLIINELVTNTLKHAFLPGQRGEIRIDFHHDQERTFLLTVSDDGRGLPAGFDYRSAGSLGLQLVLNLAEVQLRGTVDVSSEQGTTFKICVQQRESL